MANVVRTDGEEIAWVVNRVAGEAIRCGDALTCRVGEDGTVRVSRRGQGDPGCGTATRDFQEGDVIPVDGVTTGKTLGARAGRIPDSTTPQGGKRQFAIDLGRHDSLTRGTMAYAIVDLVRRLREVGLDIDAAHDADAMQTTVTVQEPSSSLPESVAWARDPDDFVISIGGLHGDLQERLTSILRHLSAFVGATFSAKPGEVTITRTAHPIPTIDGVQEPVAPHTVEQVMNALLARVEALEVKAPYWARQAEARPPDSDDAGDPIPVTREMWDALLARIGFLEDRTARWFGLGAFDAIPTPSVPVGQVWMRETTKPSPSQMIDELTEILAEHEHATWSSYMLWFLGQSQIPLHYEDLTYRIQASYVNALRDLADTTYPMLDEEQKAKDRREVAPLVPKILAWARKYGLTNP